MVRVTATEFAKNFGRYREEAQREPVAITTATMNPRHEHLNHLLGDFQHLARREPVEITRHGRRELVLMSADHYDWLVAAAKRAHRTTEAPDVALDAIRRAEMDPKDAALDERAKGSPVVRRP